MSHRKLLTAIAAYALIAISAAFTLDEKMRYAVWVLMGGLALKTLVASQQLRAQHSAEAAQRSSADEVNPHEQHNGNPQ
jgi:hypothetical protein